MNTNHGSLDALIQEEIDADTDFLASLDTLTDEDREQALQAKKSEILASKAPAFFEKAQKAEELANNYKTRAEKAEKEPKKPVAEEPKEPNDALSWKDQYALSQAQVPIDDVDEVVEYARFKKISIDEALKSSVVKTMLAEKAEFRKTADTTNAGKPRRTPSKPDAGKLVSELSEGKVPEPGSSDSEALFWARRGKRE